MSNFAERPLPPQFSRPIPTRAAKAQISAFAERLAASLQFGPNDLINSLVTRLGGKVEYRNPEIDQGGRLPESIVVYSANSFIIFVPNLTSSERDRFTIAHELGHYYLHYPLAAREHPGIPMRATRWVDEADEDQRRAEWEANWFAAAFLMPAPAFHEAHRVFAGNLALVAARFSVSTRAAEVRASTLGLA